MAAPIGTSGWAYDQWRGTFYPKGVRQAAAFDGWRQQAPPAFLYAVKASRYLTHQEADRARGAAEALL